MALVVVAAVVLALALALILAMSLGLVVIATRPAIAVGIPFLPLGTLTVALGLTLAVLVFLLFALGVLFLLRLAQHPQVMLGVLLKVLGRDAIVGQLRVTRQLVVFLDDLLRGAAHLALGSRTVEDPVYNIADRTVAVRLART